MSAPTPLTDAERRALAAAGAAPTLDALIDYCAGRGWRVSLANVLDGPAWDAYVLTDRQRGTCFGGHGDRGDPPQAALARAVLAAVAADEANA